MGEIFGLAIVRPLGLILLGIFKLVGNYGLAVILFALLVKLVILPLTMPGIFAGSIQTFIPSLGFFFISDMMGGAKTMYIGNLIKNQFLSARNWPLGAVLSIVLIVITLILMRLYTRVGSLEDMA